MQGTHRTVLHLVSPRQLGNERGGTQLDKARQRVDGGQVTGYQLCALDVVVAVHSGRSRLLCRRHGKGESVSVPPCQRVDSLPQSSVFLPQVRHEDDIVDGPKRSQVLGRDCREYGSESPSQKRPDAVVGMSDVAPHTTRYDTYDDALRGPRYRSSRAPPSR